MLAHVDFKTIGLPGEGMPQIIDHPGGTNTPPPPRPLPGPTVYWRFNATSGNEPDYADGAPLTQQNGPTTTSGAVLTARQFDGVQQYFTTPGIANLQLTAPSTIAGWLKLGSKAKQGTVLYKGNTAFTPGLPGSQFEYDVSYNVTADQIQCRLEMPDGTTAMQPILTGLTLNTWYCWCFKWDGTRLFGASNGGAFASVPFAGYPMAAHGLNPPLSTGATVLPGGPQDYWTGAIDATGIWRGTLLSDADWAAYYNLGAGREWNGSAWQP